jgi:hypothetical protein
MVRGILCNLTISLKNKVAMWEASSLLLQGMKCAIFENLSTTPKIESLALFVLGKPKTKSILMSSQGTLGMDNGMYNP